MNMILYGASGHAKVIIDILEANKDNENIIAILLDLNMPKVDGFAVLEYLREKDLFKEMPVTIISGDSSSEAINKAFTFDIVDMITKPFSEEKIKVFVESLGVKYINNTRYLKYNCKILLTSNNKLYDELVRNGVDVKLIKFIENGYYAVIIVCPSLTSLGKIVNSCKFSKKGFYFRVLYSIIQNR